MTTSRNHAPAPSGSAARVMHVLDLVLAHGPVSPARLTELSGLSRTAVHRAIHALIGQGFVRYQLGKSNVIVTAALHERMQAAYFSPPDIDPISNAVDTALRNTNMHCEIASMLPNGDYRTEESTITDPDMSRDYFSSDLVSVLLSHFSPVEVARITARKLRESDEDAKVESDFLDRFRLAQYQGYLWNAAHGTMAVRLEQENEVSIAILLQPRKNRRLPLDDCVAVCDRIHDLLPAMFPRIEAIAS